MPTRRSRGTYVHETWRAGWRPGWSMDGACGPSGAKLSWIDEVINHRLKTESNHTPHRSQTDNTRNYLLLRSDQTRPRFPFGSSHGNVTTGPAPAASVCSVLEGLYSSCPRLASRPISRVSPAATGPELASSVRAVLLHTGTHNPDPPPHLDSLPLPLIHPLRS